MKIKILEGKTKSERNKMIAAALLGVLAIFALWFAFLRNPSSSPTKVSVNVNAASPRAGVSPANPTQFAVPTADEQEFNYVTTPIVYNPGMSASRDPGRNIFAFYEPPLPTPYSPTPYVQPPIKTPEPTPTPVYLVSGVNPQSLYAGSKSFRLEVFGDRFTPDAKIYISQTEFPTRFISPQQLVTDVPAGMIATEGQRQIMVQSADGTKYSTQAMLVVQAPPKPQFQYIGMIGRKRYNNDTAYFMETGKTVPFTGRLNDVIGGRFRLLDINSSETLFEDTSLGFKHRLPVVRASAAGSGSGLPGAQPSSRGGFPQQQIIQSTDPSFMPYNPTIQQQGEIPGIPSNIPRYIPPQPAANRNPTDKKDVDDDDPR